MTNQPITKKMNKIDVAGHFLQWAIELGQFNIEYQPQVAIKAQGLVDFIAEFTYTEDEEEPLKRKRTVQTDRSTTKKARGEGVIFISPVGETLKYAVRLQFPVPNNKVK